MEHEKSNSPYAELLRYDIERIVTKVRTLINQGT